MYISFGCLGFIHGSVVLSENTFHQIDGIYFLFHHYVGINISCVDNVTMS